MSLLLALLGGGGGTNASANIGGLVSQATLGLGVASGTAWVAAPGFVQGAVLGGSVASGGASGVAPGFVGSAVLGGAPAGAGVSVAVPGPVSFAQLGGVVESGSAWVVVGGVTSLATLGLGIGTTTQSQSDTGIAPGLTYLAVLGGSQAIGDAFAPVAGLVSQGSVGGVSAQGDSLATVPGAVSGAVLGGLVATGGSTSPDATAIVQGFAYGGVLGGVSVQAQGALQIDYWGIVRRYLQRNPPPRMDANIAVGGMVGCAVLNVPCGTRYDDGLFDFRTIRPTKSPPVIVSTKKLPVLTAVVSCRVAGCGVVSDPVLGGVIAESDWWPEDDELALILGLMEVV